MLKRIFLFIIILLISDVCIAQDDIYIFQEYLKAYKNNTRSFDGKPGKDYWINKSEYKIDVFVKTETQTIKGKEQIIYYNNSPDDLSIIVLRLYQNWNKPGTSRDWNIDSNIFTNGILINNLKINDEVIDLNNSQKFLVNGTNAIIKLTEKLSSKSSINIYIEWEFGLPSVRNLRMGKYGTATYFIGYWYPQISVYDDIFGWDLNDYTGTTEFYNDFSDFDVTISTDVDNVIVWATGILENKEELFTENVLNRIEISSNSDTIIKIITKNDYIENNILKNFQGKRIWHFIAEAVPDFSFCFSDNYLWDATSLEVEPGRRCFINAVYKQEYKNFDKVSQISRDLLKYFSNEMPLVPFPYPIITVFNGAGGMEYPMMVNQSETDSFEDLVYVTTHEISHTYFPFYMGINERLYAWMDEGWAVYIPMDFQNQYTGVDTKEKNVLSYLKNAGTIKDMPLMIPSNNLKYDAYRMQAYNKSALLYDVICNMLGKSHFKKIIKEYINRWKGKHPTPYDFIFTINNLTNKNLNWFWNRWLFDFNYPDLTLKKAIIDNNYLNIEVLNKGGLPIPLVIKVIFIDKTEKEFLYSPEIWQNNSVFTTSFVIDKQILQVSIDNNYIPDCNKNDNIIDFLK